MVVALPLAAPVARSECLLVLLTSAVAEAAFCSLGDWLNVCRTPRGAVAEPRDSWLEACGGGRVTTRGGEGQHRKMLAQRSRSAQPLLALADLFPPTRTGSLESKISRPGKLYQGMEEERERDRQTDAGGVTAAGRLLWSRLR